MAKGYGLDEIRRAFDFHRTTVSRHYYIAKEFFLKRPTDSSMAQDISRNMDGGYDPSAHMIRADLRAWIEWCRLRAAQLAVVVKEPSLRAHFNANEGQLVRLTYLIQNPSKSVLVTSPSGSVILRRYLMLSQMWAAA